MLTISCLLSVAALLSVTSAFIAPVPPTQQRTSTHVYGGTTGGGEDLKEIMSLEANLRNYMGGEGFRHRLNKSPTECATAAVPKVVVPYATRVAMHEAAALRSDLLSGKPQTQVKGNRDRRGFLLVLGNLLLLPALTLKPVTAAEKINIDDLKLEIVSWSPLTVKLPASTLVPLLVAEIKAQPGLRGNGNTKRYNVDNVNVELGNDEVEVVLKGSGGTRGFTTVLGRDIYTPWVDVDVRIKGTFALGVENFVVKARETYLDIEAPNEVVKIFVRALARPIYNKARGLIEKALEKINGQNLRDIIIKQASNIPIALPPSTRFDVRVQSDGLYFILS